ENDVKGHDYTWHYDNVVITNASAPGEVLVAWRIGTPVGCLDAGHTNNKITATVTDTGTTPVRPHTWFSKDRLNDDRSAAAGTVLQKTAMQCADTDSACYSGPGATLGWMDSATLTTLNTATYGNLVPDTALTTVKVGANGEVPHFLMQN